MFKLKRIDQPKKHCPRRRSGATTVEMAMVAPVIFVMIFSSVEFARMMMVRQALTNAARQGCRNACLATTQTKSEAEVAVRESLQAVIGSALTNQNLRVTFTPDFTTAPAKGTAITSVVEIDCSDASWLPPFFTSGARIQASTTMNRE